MTHVNPFERIYSHAYLPGFPSTLGANAITMLTGMFFVTAVKIQRNPGETAETNVGTVTQLVLHY